MSGTTPRYLIVHGHFYQPPRQSPWTGLISPEHGAAPFRNWNERILSECYLANSRAHTMDGPLVHIRNNYESLSFDFGPTLLSWLELHGKSAYRAIVRSDQLSRAARDGCGNAIAQSYHHSILPLLSARDRDVQIAWGIEDFKFRFGRLPEAMWLPECAADDDTLRALAKAAMKFVILAPWQGEFRVRDGEQETGAGPFLWRDGDAQLSVFRFDRELAASLAFGDGLTDGASLADQIEHRAMNLGSGGAVLIATDGETFGHHKRNGAAELARALEILEGRETLKILNPAQYLARCKPVGTFTINRPTSWSCLHGVERWRSNCGCRTDRNTQQEWRYPLRAAVAFVKAQVDLLYDRLAPELCADPGSALTESIRLAIDANPATAEEFYFRHKALGEQKQSRLARLFEMQRAAHAAFTSCAWFFDDFGGLEGRIALRWAARAVEIAAEFAPSAEREVVARLREIRSNRREISDAATLYLSLRTREARGKV
jgi:alpha-amylase/alpha-mannosidase (GH57 family)